MLRTTDNLYISQDIEISSAGQRVSRVPSLTSGATDSSSMVAFSMEFVAKPQETHRLQTVIPSSLRAVLKGVSGFAGGLVMVSDQEARLVTVVTLWAGDDARERCAENARWVQTLLVPYIDRQVRVQFLIVFTSAPTANHAKTYSAEECFILQALPLQREEVCRVGDS